jgi:RNA polymerase sigma-70 factor (ECF subfamily)
MSSDPLDRLFERYARTGDTRALGEVYDALAPELYRVALHLARDGAEAEDLLQATFVTAIERAHTWRSGEALKPWLSGILANHARNAGRRAARAATTGEVAALDAALEPLEEASRSELDETLARALERVPEAYRPALVLRLRHGLTVAQIAEALGIPPGTVRSQLGRGTEHLRRSLPAGLVGAFAALLAPSAEGLPGIRAAILAHAEIARVPLAVGGVWLVKKWIAAALLLLLVSGAVGYGIWNDRQPGVPLATPTAEVAPEPAQAEPVVAQAPREERSSIPPASAPQVAAAAAPSTGSVELEVLYARDGEPARGGTVLLRIDHSGVSYADERCAELDQDGRARWDEIPACGVVAHALPGGMVSGIVTAGRTLRLRLKIPDGIEVQCEVVDAAERPVPGAQIWLSEPGQPAVGYVCGRCDAQGRLRLRSVGAQRWIGAKSDTAALSYLQCVRGVAGGTQQLHIVLEREAARLTGTVLDDQHRPVARAQVLAGSEETVFGHLLADGMSVPVGAPQRTEADEAGRFEFRGLPLGPCTLRARAAGLVGPARTLELHPGSNRADVALEREALVAGRVCDASGTPVGGVRVFSGAFGHFDSRIAHTAPDGSFTLRGLEPGERALVAEQPDGGRAEETLLLRAGERCEWNPRLSLPEAIRGTVRTPEGRPLAGWSLVLGNEDRAQPGWESGNTDADGRFLLKARPERSYRLSVFEPQRWSDFPRAELRGVHLEGPELSIEIREDGADEASLRARILDTSGKPVPDARLIVFHVEQDLWRELAPDERGDLLQAHIPPGHLRLEARSAGHPWQKLAEREVRAGERVELGTIELANGGRVAGTLRGAGAAQIEISVADARGLLAGTIEIHGSEYHSNALAPGSYRLYVRGTGVGDQQHDFEISAGRELRLDLVLEPMLVRKLVLQTGERTRASKYITCFVNDAAGRQLCMRSLPVAGAASLELELSMPAGEHQLVVWGEAGSLLETRISASGAGSDPALALTLP